ncbi:hypothetical protein AVEN_111428-1 [Araneus ventricosus]|uniref:Uncharacterized protein n=1 Tax=Araneus ventricosus TaxID=182803 RepID=A0A4Y2HCM0_ARAVE|nr:hypothetical protein AVEN_111428-1 [Araneus ventricosus]
MIRQDNANESIRADDEFRETKGTPFSKPGCPITGGEKAAAGERNDALSATEELPVSAKMSRNGCGGFLFCMELSPGCIKRIQKLAGKRVE